MRNPRDEAGGGAAHPLAATGSLAAGLIVATAIAAAVLIGGDRLDTRNDTPTTTFGASEDDAVHVSRSVRWRIGREVDEVVDADRDVEPEGPFVSGHGVPAVPSF